MDTPRTKDWWDKIDIVAKSMLSVVVAAVGIYVTATLDERQRNEATERSNNDLNARREESDSKLRQEMFKHVLSDFLKKPASSLPDMVRGIELLSVNFNDTFDISPIFASVYEQSDRPLKRRLLDLSAGVIERQLETFSSSQDQRDIKLILKASTSSDGNTKIDTNNTNVTFDSIDPQSGQKTEARIELLSIDMKRVSAQLNVSIDYGGERKLTDRTIWLSVFDFPALNNFRLPNRQRLALTLNQIDQSGVQLTVVRFAERYASLKDKPDLDEIKRSRFWPECGISPQ
jgi:hypothetical protein